MGFENAVMHVRIGRRVCSIGGRFVEDLGGGRYMIMDGMTRAEAARRAGLTKLPVQIVPKSGP